VTAPAPSPPDQPVVEPVPAVRLPGSLRPLGHRNFALYWVGFAASNTGKHIEQLGSVWLIFELTDSPLALGLLGIARAVPSLILSPVAGVVVDRVDQRKLLFLTQFLALLASLALGLVIVSGAVEPWMVYLEVMAQGAITAFDAATRQALFPRLVARSELPEAVTLTVTAARTAALVGPLIGGVAIATWGVAAPFLLNGVTFLALMLAVVLMRGIPPLPERVRSTFRAELAEGIGYMRRKPVLNGLLRMEIVFNIFCINNVIIAIVGREVLGVGPTGLGGLLAAHALGSLIGVGSVLAFGQTQRQGRFTLVCSVAYAGALLVFSQSTSYVLSFIAITASGFMDVLMTVTRNTIMQLTAPGEMRGRLMANMRVVTGGIGPLGETQSGVLSALVGGSRALVIAATALAASAAIIARTNPTLWQFNRSDAAPPPEPATTWRASGQVASDPSIEGESVP
jgi:MFS family permease